MAIGFIKLGIKDLIEIAILTFIVYKGIEFLRRTVATQILIGIVFIILLLPIIEFLNLVAFKWLVGVLKSVGILALIIIFQPEIRRMLASIGRIRVLRVLREDLKRIIDETALAVGELQERGLGALIIIERNQRLDQFIEETGTKIGADIDSSLIVTIFLPDSPLHDGAVVVRGKRIEAAGVILPLSENYKVVRGLGTRHRAAVGITEVTDCVSIVVSEEKKTIRVAFRGGLSEPITVKELRRRLYAFLG